MAKSIQDITGIITKFADDRGWVSEKPNHLLVALQIELAELAEHYQWKDQFEELDEEEKTALAYEYVDVIFYLFRMASRSGIDIEKYFDEKVKKLEKKYPIGQTKEDRHRAHKEYRQSGKNRLYND